MPSTTRTPRAGHATGRSRPAALLVVLGLVLALVVGCAGATETADTGPRTTKPETTTTTTTTAPEPPAPVTQVATAVVPQVEVHAQIPDAGASATAPPTPDIPVGAVPAIPRPGYLSAGVASTEAGWRFDNPTFFGNPLVFVVTAEHQGWLRVRLPARPNQQEGWIRAEDVTLSQHDDRIELDLSDRYLRAFDGNEVVAETSVVIGAPGTPTPTGTYYLTEALPRGGGANPGGAYGAWILPTNGYSEAMTEFDDGLPVIALHGTNNPGAVGSAISNGCVRLPDPVISVIAERLPAGTPVIITD